MGTEPRLQKLLERFVSRFQRITAMEALLRRQSMDELRHALHQLKGAGGGYGFSAISDHAGLAEQLIRNQAAADTIQKQVNELINIVRSVEGYDMEKESYPQNTVAA